MTGPPGQVVSKRILDEKLGLATGQPEILVEAALFFWISNFRGLKHGSMSSLTGQPNEIAV